MFLNCCSVQCLHGSYDRPFDHWLDESGHSDPLKLKEKASNVQQMSADELKARQLEIKVFPHHYSESSLFSSSMS